jgi:hypothetical protein
MHSMKPRGVWLILLILLPIELASQTGLPTRLSDGHCVL